MVCVSICGCTTGVATLVVMVGVNLHSFFVLVHKPSSSVEYRPLLSLWVIQYVLSVSRLSRTVSIDQFEQVSDLKHGMSLRVQCRLLFEGSGILLQHRWGEDECRRTPQRKRNVALSEGLYSLPAERQ